MRLIRPVRDYVEPYMDALYRGLECEILQIQSFLKQPDGYIKCRDPLSLLQLFDRLAQKTPHAAHVYWYVHDTRSENPLVRAESTIRTYSDPVNGDKLCGEINIAITPRNMRNKNIAPAKMLRDATDVLSLTLDLCNRDGIIFNESNRPDKVLVVCKKNGAVNSVLTQYNAESVSDFDHPFGLGVRHNGYWIKLG